MRQITNIVLLLFSGCFLNAQNTNTKKDSITVLDEVELLTITKHKIETDMKQGVSVDEYLSASENISFIKRGGYAWEPLLNNMSTERSNITIDGMHVFGACTDKMDPVTSYVESNNLSAINIKSGQEGNLQGSTVAGSIDLKRKNTTFSSNNLWKGNYQSGYEFNNKQFFNLGNVSFSNTKLAADASLSYRKAENYSDGNNNKVNHSQFKKLNSSIGLAYKTGALSSLKLDAIVDVAKDVGYPALPMDLWLSRALITSLSYKQLFKDKLIKIWDSKLYFNTVEHYMDDTTRPENLVHMDMPGWTTTYGLLSKIELQKDNFSSEIQVNAYNNLSIAEMRMYPQDRSETTMFAYSWPWVTTQYAGISTTNTLDLSYRSQFNFGGSLGVHYNYSKYVEFNWIFYPGAPQEKTRILPSLFANYHLNINDINFSVGAGYGHRAPSVSEGYGYYIYNSFDRYDYVGNPNLKNEVSYEANAKVSYKTKTLNVSATFNYFFIDNYIIGEILSLGSPMNYQSVGVKAYTSLDYATLFNFSLNADYTISKNLHWTGVITYARGQDNNKGNLPFIRPFSYLTTLHYQFHNFGVQTSVNGDLEQINYSPQFGEDQTPGFTIWNASTDYTFRIKNKKTVLQIGVENILNTYYSTYADWGNIPRMGRNFFTSLKINL